MHGFLSAAGITLMLGSAIFSNESTMMVYSPVLGPDLTPFLASTPALPPKSTTSKPTRLPPSSTWAQRHRSQLLPSTPPP
eukprot:760327-Hanusia_phi.AAC.11